MQKNLLKNRYLRASLFTFLLASGSNLQAQQTGLHFDGTNDYIQTNYPGVLGTGSRTVEAWVKTTATTGEQLVVDWGSDAVNGRRFTVRLVALTGGNYSVRIEIKGGFLNGTAIVNDGNWHHIAVVYDVAASTNKYKIYVDGILNVQGSTGQTINTTAETNLIIGRRLVQSFGGYFNGTIDEVRIWNTARTQAEIQASMNAEFCANPVGLTAYFKMNDGTANAINTATTSISSAVGSFTGAFNGFALIGTTSNFVAGATSLATVNIDNTIAFAGGTLSANQAGSTYQWVDCGNINAPITGATNQTFTPVISGSYAVIVTQSGCSQTSNCVAVTAGGAVCEAPTAVAVSTITETGATVTWTAGDNETEWEIKYGVTGFSPATAGTMVEAMTTPSKALINLTDGIAYDVYVRAVCGDSDISVWTGPVAFTTIVDVCEAPTAVAVSAITETTATVTWTAGDDETEWEVKYGVTGFSPATAGTMVEAMTTPSKTLINLIDDTAYDVYVRAVCGDSDTSVWTGPVAFTTIVDVCEAPTAVAVSDIMETAATVTWTAGNEETEWEVKYGATGFDALTEGTTVEASITAEMEITDLTDGTAYDVYVRAVCGDEDMSVWTGPVAFTTIVDVCEAPTAVAVSDITETVATVSWTAGNEETEWEVKYGATGFDALTEGTTVEASITAEMEITDLTDGTAYDVYVRAVCGDEDMSVWTGPVAFTTIVDVCEAPTAVAVSDIAETTATVSWTAGNEETEWEVKYGETGFDALTEGTTVEASITAEALLSDLTDGTAYDIYVRAVCGDEDMSVWTGPVAFTTIVDVCEAPTAVAISDIAETAATVTWTAGNEETEWEVKYGVTGFDPLTEGTTVEASTTAEALLSDLIANTQYDVYVRAVCGDDNMSAWTSPVAFSTEELGINNHKIQGFVFYPNPTTGKIALGAQNTIENIEIFNLTGQRVMAVNVDAMSSEINIEKLPSGIYLMQVTVNAQVGIYKIVRK